MKLTFFATRDELNCGTGLHFDCYNAFEKAIVGLSNGQRVSITINTDIPKTREQLGYYWGVVIETFLFEGATKQGIKHTKQDMHDILLAQYAYATNLTIDVSESTQAEMSDYMDWCVDWVNEMFNTQIPKAERKN